MDHALNRRDLLLATGTLAVTAAGTGLVADEKTCIVTPSQTPGPFYPRPEIAKQKHTDNDLTRKFEKSELAMGEAIVVAGAVRGPDCGPLKNAIVEIWQACASGRYNHERDSNEAELDDNFQYWGRVVTGEDGKYRFKTIKPGEYPGRTAHIHFRVLAEGHRGLLTQMYFAEESKRNARDFIYNDLSRAERNAVTTEFMKPTGKTYRHGEFDIVLAAR